MNNKLLMTAALFAGLVVSQPSFAAEKVVFWDFFVGGDGIRMKELVSKFNAEHAGKIEIEQTTLEWGQPFYTKVQTATAIGEGPDLMSYMVSRLPGGIASGVVAPLDPSDLKAAGVTADDFSSIAWNAVQSDGKTYALPFDSHPLVLFYNKEKLAKAGLIGPDGLPQNLDTVAGFEAALKKLQGEGTKWAITMQTAEGPMTRFNYSLLGQQGGTMLTDGEWLAGDNEQKLVNAVRVSADWVKNGLMPQYTEYSAAIALFTSGEAAFHLNGVWEVPTMNDLAAKGQLFEWGAIELPTFFDKKATFVDSHILALPNNKGRELTPEKRAAIFEVAGWMLRHGQIWASAGHIPALKAVVTASEYQKMQPNATYAVAIDHAVYDVNSKFAGIGGPAYVAAASAFTAALNGEETPEDAVSALKEQLNALQ